MNEIKFPPLPYPQIPGNDYTAADMKAYAEEAVRQALAAQVFRSIADERRAFEAWARNEWGNSADSMLMRDNDGDYLYLNTEWCSWIRRATKGQAESSDQET